MTLYSVFVLISKAMYIYTSEMAVEAKNIFHKSTASGLTVLGQHSPSQMSSAEKLGILVQLICFCWLCWLVRSELS